MGVERILLLMTVTSNMSTGSTVERKPIPASVAVREAPAEISSTVSTYCLDAARFQPKPEKKSRAEPDDVLIGFDTEYLVPETPVSNEDIRSGAAKYRVVSYQFHCLLQGVNPGLESLSPMMASGCRSVSC